MLVGVVGTGVMGLGIAQVLSKYEKFNIILCGSSLESAQRGKHKIEDTLNKLIIKQKLTKELANCMLGRIEVGVKDDCYDCDLIIESIIENLEVKHNLFLFLDSICKDECVFVTNTSSLSITEIGANLKHHVVGMHFFNPAPVMSLVEVTAGLNTPNEITDYVYNLAKDIGKSPIKVKEHAGFVVNRLLIPMINEAVCVYADGVATVEDIDNAMRLGANHPMGPLALGDLIGLDVVLIILETLQNETGDNKYRPHPLLRKMVRGGWLGKKSGKGFYNY